MIRLVDPITSTAGITPSPSRENPRLSKSQQSGPRSPRHTLKYHQENIYCETEDFVSHFMLLHHRKLECAACKFPKHESSEKKTPVLSRGQRQPRLRVSTFRSSPTEHWECRCFRPCVERFWSCSLRIIRARRWLSTPLSDSTREFNSRKSGVRRVMHQRSTISDIKKSVSTRLEDSGLLPTSRFFEGTDIGEHNFRHDAWYEV
jgi:hypothetical protein